jgi:hypothetical protein
MVANNQEVVSLQYKSGQEFDVVLSTTHVDFDVLLCIFAFL